MFEVLDLKFLICVVIFLGAIAQDLYMKKVKNKYILFSLIIILVSVVSLNGLSNSIQLYKNLILSFIIGFSFYFIKVIGAGDAKLFTVISLLLPIGGIADTFIYSLIWGAIFGTFRYFISGKLQILFQNLINMQKILIISKKDFGEGLRLQSIPYTIPLFLGFLMDWTLAQKGIHLL